jgi:diaminohydroxyphosphoribosylaminopyrimidine deaminase/5-amino-6-(5-phosphoribosylamino)uracil reductase
MTAPLRRALDLSTQALTTSNPNPRVGCVITDNNGTVLGEGFTQVAGHAHAEVMALRHATSQGHAVSGATAWVTLEPCSHFGRTPPCCEALVAAGIGTVHIATLDPNPLVAGQGAERLRAAGVQVHVLPPNDALAQAVRRLNIGFFSRMQRGTPWVRMKVAASLDGITALPNGQSQWITGPEARRDGHAWRARACAVLTGIGTVLEDDPMLDVRDQPVTRQPHLVVVDSELQTPLHARLWQVPAQSQPRQIWLAHHGQPSTAAALCERGATLLPSPGPGTKVDLLWLLAELGRREVNELHLEAGHKLNGSFLREGLVDELLVYLAPTWLGQGAGMSRFGPLESLQQALALRFEEVTPVGADLRVRAVVQGRDSWLGG